MFDEKLQRKLRIQNVSMGKKDKYAFGKLARAFRSGGRVISADGATIVIIVLGLEI